MDTQPVIPCNAGIWAVFERPGEGYTYLPVVGYNRLGQPLVPSASSGDLYVPHRAMFPKEKYKGLIFDGAPGASG